MSIKVWASYDAFLLQDINGGEITVPKECVPALIEAMSPGPAERQRKPYSISEKSREASRTNAIKARESRARLRRVIVR